MDELMETITSGISSRNRCTVILLRREGFKGPRDALGRIKMEREQGFLVSQVCAMIGC